MGTSKAKYRLYNLLAGIGVVVVDPEITLMPEMREPVTRDSKKR